MKTQLVVNGDVVSYCTTWKEVMENEALPPTPRKAFYFDDEGDKIKVSCEADFLEAQRWANSEGLQALELHFAHEDGEDEEEGWGMVETPSAQEEWQAFVDNNMGGGKTYYFNTRTLETTWECPPSLQEQQEEESDDLLADFQESPSPVENELSPSPPPPSPPSNAVVHTGIKCTGCAFVEESSTKSLEDGFITGPRYQSLVLPTMSFCSTCEQTGKFDSDFAPFVKISLPSMAPEYLVSDRTETGVAKEFTKFLLAKQDKSASCGHELKEHESVHGDLCCNACHGNIEPRRLVYSCRECEYDLCHKCYFPPQSKFVCDVTLPDNTSVVAGQRVNKVWRVKNTGNRAWPIGTQLVNVGGNLKAPAQVVDALAAPGDTVNVSIQLDLPANFTGQCTSYWRLATKDGTVFGHRFWVSLQVAAPPPKPGGTWQPKFPGMILSQPQQVPTSNATNEFRGVVLNRGEKEQEEQRAVNYIVESGFTDLDKIKRLLREENGDIARTVDRLLE